MTFDSKTALVANGAHEDYSWLTNELKNFTQIIGVDGGILALQKCGITPSEVLGDFDSSSEPKHILAHKFPKEKDETDLELALKKYTLNGCNPVVVYGALGKGIDHEIANLLLLHRYPNLVEYRSRKTTACCLMGKHHFIQLKGLRIGLFSLQGGATISTKGLRWDLVESEINYEFFSISNYSPSGECMLEVHKGSVLFTRCSERLIS